LLPVTGVQTCALPILKKSTEHLSFRQPSDPFVAVCLVC
jgi:hypothetical protein